MISHLKVYTETGSLHFIPFYTSDVLKCRISKRDRRFTLASETILTNTYMQLSK